MEGGAYALFDNTGLCSGWCNAHALGSGRPSTVLIPGPSVRVVPIPKVYIKKDAAKPKHK